MTRHLVAIPLLALATCFSGDSTRGLPCTGAKTCGDGLACVDDVCGGKQTQTMLTGLSILFVITDDPESGPLQARLAEAAAPFLKTLVNAEIDTRIGVISTSMAHPLCGPGDDGRLLLSSCRDRPEDFVNEQLDITADACTSRCEEGVQGDAAVPLATPTEPSGPAEKRPWVQFGKVYDKNLYYDDLTPDRLIGCFLPRGINGCAYEQPLAALLRALGRMQNPMDANYGFVPDGGQLVVIFVARGNECSYAADAAGIFDPEGEKHLWPTPHPEDPSPAICWRAGVDCTNLQDGTYFECHPVDRTVTGNLATRPEDAALLPVDTTAAAVAQAVADMNAHLLIASIVGVPPMGALEYRQPPSDMPSPFGIGPGCESEATIAAPPLRLIAFAEAASPVQAYFPACAPDLAKPLTALSRQLVTRMLTPLPPQ